MYHKEKTVRLLYYLTCINILSKLLLCNESLVIYFFHLIRSQKLVQIYVMLIFWNMHVMFEIFRIVYFLFYHGHVRISLPKVYNDVANIFKIYRCYTYSYRIISIHENNNAICKLTRFKIKLTIYIHAHICCAWNALHFPQNESIPFELLLLIYGF